MPFRVTHAGKMELILSRCAAGQSAVYGCRFKSSEWGALMDNREHFILAGWLIDGSGGPIQKKALLKIVDGRIADCRPL